MTTLNPAREHEGLYQFYNKLFKHDAPSMVAFTVDFKNNDELEVLIAKNNFKFIRRNENLFSKEILKSIRKAEAKRTDFMYDSNERSAMFPNGLENIENEYDPLNCRTYYTDKNKNLFVVEKRAPSIRCQVLNSDYDKAKEMAKLFSKLFFVPLPKKSKGIYIVRVEHNELCLTPIEKQFPKVDIKMNYGDDFEKVDEKVMHFIKEKDGGIMILHGDPGTGKSFYLKHLSNFIPEGKKLVYLTSGMLKQFSSPTLTNFCLANKNTIFLVEDAEDLVVSREENPNATEHIATLLNLGDGILGEAINSQVILTFNVSHEKLDKAITRKGRLFLRHEFTKLNQDQANRLLKSLSKPESATGPMSLADIYFAEIDNGGTVPVVEPKRMGFGA